MLSMTRYSIKDETLIPLVKFIWHFETENANIHHKLLPTDCIDIVLNLSDEMIYEAGSHIITAPSFHVNGLRDSCSYIHQTGSIHILGISFYSFGLFPFVGKSLRDIQNKITDLFTLSTSLAQKLRAAVSCDTIQDMIENIEKALLSELHTRKDYIHKTSLIRDFMEADDNATIQSFCMERGINIKTFERTVLHYTGYTPKLLRRIKRFQTASNQLVHQSSVNLVGVTYDNSFTDQAHFTKEFQKFSGVSPRTFQQEKATIKENTRYSYI